MSVAFNSSKNHGSGELSRKLSRILIPAEYELCRHATEHHINNHFSVS